MLRAPDFGELPPRIARLPMFEGWPVPWFVDQTTDTPDFRVSDLRKFYRAIKEEKCWTCGEPMGHWLAFPLGPMCSISRTISEPPSHRECAEWSIKWCPFLNNPEMVRRREDVPAEALEPAGFALLRNPGVMALWMTRTFESFKLPDGRHLLTVGEPANVTWWCQGRSATRAEVQAAVESGIPNLLAVAKMEGRFAVEELEKQVKRAEKLWPA
jgi:hypothetical protein